MRRFRSSDNSRQNWMLTASQMERLTLSSLRCKDVLLQRKKVWVLTIQTQHLLLPSFKTFLLQRMRFKN